MTNYRDPDGTDPAPRSRGDLPLDYLAGVRSTAVDYLGEVAGRARDYAGFNLLVGDRGSLWYLSNSDRGPPREPAAPGIYGLSNAVLDTPWPKVELGKASIGRTAGGSGQPSHDALWPVVATRRWRTPENAAKLGLERAMDPLLSAQFIVTRVTTALDPVPPCGLDRTALQHWRERGFDASGSASARTTGSIHPGRLKGYQRVVDELLHAVFGEEKRSRRCVDLVAVVQQP